jgi:hypothetical protein
MLIRDIIAPVRRQLRTDYPHSPSATRPNFAKRPTERNDGSARNRSSRASLPVGSGSIADLRSSFSETHSALLIRDIIARMRHDGCGGREGGC